MLGNSEHWEVALEKMTGQKQNDAQDRNHYFKLNIFRVAKLKIKISKIF